MQITMFSGEPAAAKANLIVYGIFSGKKSENAAYDAHRKELGKGFAQALKRRDFSGKAGQKFSLQTLNGTGSTEMVVLGLGDSAKVTSNTILNLAGEAVKAANGAGVSSVALVLPKLDGDLARVAELMGRGATMGTYRYDKHRSSPGRAHTLKKVKILSEGGEWSPADKKACKKAITRGVAVGAGVVVARDLVNDPPGHLYPEAFAQLAEEMAKANGLKVKTIKPAQLKKMNMNLLLGVGQGSQQTPRLVHLSYMPTSAAGKKRKPIVFVGKGITFDSGGLSLKPPASMMGMKMDMGGAAAVMGAMRSIAELKPDVPVHGLLALAENMPSGTAIRPGDVIQGASGRTVEINNTDAEGRLVMADTLHYAVGLEPARIVDLATLTGACMVALGPHTVGLFSNNDDLAEDLLDSADEAGEHFWRMPLTEQLKEQLKSDIADTKNTGERFGGAITAALFLKEFVADVPWAHLDIAGPATSSSSSGAAAKGGSGVGVATLVELAAPAS
jgi:leucyl aminopeptidase